jgi:hypothetical protein
VDRHKLQDPLKWKAVPSFSTPFLHYPDVTFDLRDVLVGACQVDNRTTWQRLDQRFDRREFTVGMYRHDAEAALEIILIYLLECLEYLRNSFVHEVVAQ